MAQSDLGLFCTHMRFLPESFCSGTQWDNHIQSSCYLQRKHSNASLFNSGKSNFSREAWIGDWKRKKENTAAFNSASMVMVVVVVLGFIIILNNFPVISMVSYLITLFLGSSKVVSTKYLHFHCESLNEPLHLRCGSYLHEQIELSHTHIRAIWAG